MNISEIRSDIEVPFSAWNQVKFPTKGRPQNLLRHRIESLEISQSIVIDIDEKDDIHKFVDRIRASAKHAARKTGRKFIVRKAEKIVTVWRVQ